MNRPYNGNPFIAHEEWGAVDHSAMTAHAEGNCAFPVNFLD